MNTISKVAIAVAALVLVGTVYQSLFSDKARAIKELEKQIEAREQQISELSKQYEQLAQQEQLSLQKIQELKIKMQSVAELVNENEGQLDEIKSQLPDVENDLNFLDDLTSRSLASINTGRGLLKRLEPGAGD